MQGIHEVFTINYMPSLHLPCIRGVIGNWTYYSTVMTIENIVTNRRIITVAESADLYSNNFNEILQREIDSTRINQISSYLINSDERFFSSLIVAIHDGNPEWSDIDIKENFQIRDQELNPDSQMFLNNKFGILTLSGNEQIFALDGQHRLVGLRRAFETSPELGDQELSILFVVHNPDNKERTRRLFTVLNKFAKKPKQAELIILDEDDASCINTRRLLDDNQLLNTPGAISISNTGNIPVNDFASITTMVTVYKINRILNPQSTSFYNQRPNQGILDRRFNMSSSFWDFLHECFPEIEQSITDQNIVLNGHIFNRNPDTGGSLLLRPVGQELLAYAFRQLISLNQIDVLRENIRNIDFNLSGDVFKYIYWANRKMLGRNLLLKKRIIPYLLGLEENEDDFHLCMTNLLGEFNIQYNTIPSLV